MLCGKLEWMFLEKATENRKQSNTDQLNSIFFI